MQRRDGFTLFIIIIRTQQQINIKPSKILQAYKYNLSVTGNYSNKYSIHDRYYSQVEVLDAAVPVDNLLLNDCPV